MVHLSNVWFCTSIRGCDRGNYPFYLYTGIWGSQTSLQLGNWWSRQGHDPWQGWDASKTDRVCKIISDQCCNRKKIYQTSCRGRYRRRLGWSASCIDRSTPQKRIYTGIFKNVRRTLWYFQGKQFRGLCNVRILHPWGSKDETSAYDGNLRSGQSGDR